MTTSYMSHEPRATPRYRRTPPKSFHTVNFQSEGYRGTLHLLARFITLVLGESAIKPLLSLSYWILIKGSSARAVPESPTGPLVSRALSLGVPPPKFPMNVETALIKPLPHLLVSSSMLTTIPKSL